jgi:oligopeptide/dipeptide ABC transporter ATP-binding protein
MSVLDGEQPLLEVRNLKTHFITRRGVGRAVENVSLKLFPGKTLGLVGESGSGKSMTALSLLRLHPEPAAQIVGGEVLFRGEDLLKKTPKEMQRYRGKHLAYVPQDPLSSLNPVFRIGEQVEEPMRIHLKLGRGGLRHRAVELLQRVQVPAAEDRISSYPHQLSGGTRQRVVSAIGISCNPEVLVADEPTTSLDVTVQAVYLDLLRDIQQESGLSILFITHDFGIVANLCDEVAVMYAGGIVEHAPTEELFDRPRHPYTQALMAALPDPTRIVDRLMAIPGQPPSIFDRTTGCPFAPRCQHVTSVCLEQAPPSVALSAQHSASCWNLV